MKKRIVVIGGGFAGLAASALLSDENRDVVLLERHETPGGRARSWEVEGYTFDMGPSWYLMPEVFDRFFSLLGERKDDYYQLKRLDPAYRVYFEGESQVDVPGRPENVGPVFEGFEKNGAEKLRRYLAEAEFKYRVAVDEFLYRDYEKVTDFFDRRLMVDGLKLHVFRRLDSHVRRYFSTDKARKILEYAMVFLGSSPTNAPALYSLMSHVDLSQGVWFPLGGMGAVAEGFAEAARRRGVDIRTGRESVRIVTSGGRVTGVESRSASGPGETELHEADVVLSCADYHWTETRLLKESQRSYSKRWWNRKVLAPSMFLAYLGIPRPIPEAAHHNLYFSRDWDRHFKTIFKKPSWPENPCWYLSRTTSTQSTMAPPGKENMFLLVPVAPDLDDSDRELYFEKMVGHVQQTAGINLDGAEVKRLFTHRDFSRDYHSFGGSALSLSHTLFQTAVFRPSRRSRKVENLFYAGQYTHPGVGVPMVIIAAELAAKAIGASL